MRTHRLILTCILLFAAAHPARADDVTLLGTGIGAAVGGLFGNQFGHGGGQAAATGIGIAAGGLIGNGISQSIENNARQPSYANGGYVYEPPAPIIYQSYAPNYVAPPAPPPIYTDEQAGTYCREFSQDIFIDGRRQESYGTACLQPDGAWRIVQ